MVAGNKYKVRVEDVFSADDMQLSIQIGISGMSISKRCRLKGVDAPVAYKKPAESPEGQMRDKIKKELSLTRCMVETVSEAGKSLIVILYYQQDGEWRNLNDELIALGYVFQNDQKGKENGQANQA